jgi:hypothetical protein
MIVLRPSPAARKSKTIPCSCEKLKDDCNQFNQILTKILNALVDYHVEKRKDRNAWSYLAINAELHAKVRQVFGLI